ncbi:hypothetical protein [Paracoccus aminophilus]|uniref:hypothetical protein n=1 Tax=Paracoccus aminophilus TaxID=34003 RepID=UPI0004212E19|nr:hypothetical protein [Paracoccus aminophilus]
MAARFRADRNGWIVDNLTGLYILQVAVHVLDVEAAHRVTTSIIAALHAEFGPANPDPETCPAQFTD